MLELSGFMKRKVVTLSLPLAFLVACSNSSKDTFTSSTERSVGIDGIVSLSQAYRELDAQRKEDLLSQDTLEMFNEMLDKSDNNTVEIGGFTFDEPRTHLEENFAYLEDLSQKYPTIGEWVADLDIDLNKSLDRNEVLFSFEETYPYYLKDNSSVQQMQLVKWEANCGVLKKVVNISQATCVVTAGAVMVNDFVDSLGRKFIPKPLSYGLQAVSCATYGAAALAEKVIVYENRCAETEPSS